MIEQYTIATTPRYNFPPPPSDTSLPQRFTELSLHSLKNTRELGFQLNQYTMQQVPNNLGLVNKINLNTHVIALKPQHKPSIVAAVDTSSIRISQTDAGMLAAVRGAIVWKQNRHYRYTRFGPYVFHLTEDNKSNVYRMLLGYSPETFEDDRRNYLSLAQMPMKIANLLERWLQAKLCETVNQGLVLFDGSLICGIGDTPIHLMKRLLTTARKRENVVMAFSKMTNLRINGHLITESLPEHKHPYLLEMTGIETKPPVLLLGEVYVAHFCTGRYAFRVDIDREIGFQQRVAAAEKLLWNESLSQGYPETLRLAHILCTFTANEVIAMQHFAVRKCGVRIIDRVDMHKLLFGPFGRGEYLS